MPMEAINNPIKENIKDEEKINNSNEIIREGLDEPVNYPISENKIKEEIEDSSEQNMPMAKPTRKECPNCFQYCKEMTGILVGMDGYGREKVYQCFKCGLRYSIEKQEEIKEKGFRYCQFCGKKSAKLKSMGVYECKSCGSSFKLN